MGDFPVALHAPFGVDPFHKGAFRVAGASWRSTPGSSAGICLHTVGTGDFRAVSAGVKVNFTARDHHFDEARIGNRFLFQPEAGKEAREIPGTLQTDFPRRMALSLEEQEAENQVAKAMTAVRFENPDIAEAEGTILPPDAADTGRDAVLKDDSVPAEGVEIIGTAAEDRSADGKNGREILAGSEPFTLNQ